MTFDFKPAEWLALQRTYCYKPKLGLAALKQYSLLSLPSTVISKAEKDLQAIQTKNFQLLCWGEKNYPPLLQPLHDPPLVLMLQGAKPVWEERPWVAVVGARKASPWGLKKTDQIVKELVAAGCGIISGFAYGVDYQSHKSCLEAGGVTWGVLGSGLDCIYPRRNYHLIPKMTERGGLISEFPLGTAPLAKHFPQRNRIIAGLSQAIVVVEAAERSGALITADFSLQLGREVFIVEPQNDHIATLGNRRWLEAGAKPYQNAEQLLGEL